LAPKEKATPWDGFGNAFGNAFGNKAAVMPQNLVIPIALAERVGYSA